MSRLDAITFRIFAVSSLVLVFGGIFGARNWLLIAAGIVWLPSFCVLMVIAWLQKQGMRKASQGRSVDVDEGGR